MKRTITLAAVIMLISISALAQSQDKKLNSGNKVEQQILTLNKEWGDAIVRGDMVALARLFDDGLIVTAGNGSTRGKTEEMNDSKPTPELKTYFFNTEDVKVRVYDDSAVVTGTAKWRINFRGRDVDHEVRYMSVYTKQKGVWRMVALHVTRPGQPMMRPSPQQPQ